jgi:hypothetical protein
MNNINNKIIEPVNIEYQKIDTLVPTSFANFLETELTNMNSWMYVPSASGHETVYDSADTNIIDSSQFSHIIYDFEYRISSRIWEYVSPMLWFLEDRTGYRVMDIGRIKANLLLPGDTKKNNYNPPHTDMEMKGYTSMVYYVNDSDGDTRIFDKHIEDTHVNLTMTNSNIPKKGSAILFPSTQYHCSSNPIDYKTRIVINFVLKLSKS